MSKSDLEMEDVEKLPNDSGNNVQESKSKVVDGNIESTGEKLPYAAAISGNAIESERYNGGGELNKSRNEEKDDIEVNTEVNDQPNHKSEVNDEGSAHEQIISTKNGNEELINTKTKAEEPTGLRSPVEKQTDDRSGVVKTEVPNSGMKKENSPENGMEDGDSGKYAKENPDEDVTEKNPENICKLIPDAVELVSLGEKTTENVVARNATLPTNEAPQNQKMDKGQQGEVVQMNDAADLDKDKPVKDDMIEQGAETIPRHETDGNDQTVVIATTHDGGDASRVNQHEAATPDSLVRYSSAKAGDQSGETFKTVFTQATHPLTGESDDGTQEDQIAFMKELESFYRKKAMDFKPPKFYGQPLNCLKLWRAVIRLGGYDTCNWSQVVEADRRIIPSTKDLYDSFLDVPHFLRKVSLLEYERHKTQCGELQLPVPTPPEASVVDCEGSGYQGSGSGRARRDAAARAMQGWHAQRLSGHGEDKTLSNMAKREKNFKSIVLATSVADVGPPADWVKINVRQTKECFEVYALVPGLLREEVRVQSDPAGRLVITGQPEQVDNPWGITPFKKVISLPARIDPLETSAVVSLHGRLFVRVPFEQSNK
ncbi:hypothetical protein OROMI_010561 [Orobanche minor]